MTDPPTVVACLTPPGSGAIAVLAVRGPEAWPVVRSAFRPASNTPLPPDLPDAGTVWFGHFGGDGLADEVVVTIKQVSPQPWLEIHCHGGRQVITWLAEMLAQRGLKPCSRAEFLNRVDPAQAAVLELLARAPTARTAAILLDQANGAMKGVLAEIHAQIQRGDEIAASNRIDAILSRSRLGRHLVEPWRVVIAGAPNVGKSSLANALAGYQRSAVAPVPGTTRDLVTAVLAIDGWPVELCDTAGLRDDATGLEREGVRLTRDVLVEADLILWVVDSTVDPTWPDAETAVRNPLMVVNKTDQPAAWDVAAVRGAVVVSALTGAGIAGLCDAVSRRLVPDPPAAGDAVPFLPSHVEALGAAGPHNLSGR